MTGQPLSQLIERPSGFDCDEWLDVRNLRCPMPLLKTKQRLHKMNPQAVLWVCATDPGSERDIPAYCQLSTHQLLNAVKRDNEFHYLIKKDGDSQ